MNVDPAKVRQGEPPEGGPEWAAAVASFKANLTTPSCAGKETQPWCTVTVNQTECEKGQLTSNYQKALTWVADPSAPQHGGWCKLRYQYSIDDHMENPLEACRQLFQGADGVCKGENEDSETDCAAADWLSFLGRDVQYHQIASVTKHVRDEESGNEEIIVIRGDSTMCELEQSCNW